MSSNISLSLSNTFGGIPDLVYEHLKYLKYDESSEEFNCKLCDKVLPKTSPNNLEAHLKSVSHRGKSWVRSEITQELIKDFRGKIPQLIENNTELLHLYKEGYECVICDKLIKLSKDPTTLFNNFSYHLLGQNHKENVEDYQNILAHLSDVYGEIPQIVNNNKSFLKLDKSRKNYVCIPCNVLLKVKQNDMEQTKNEFEEHFYSADHAWNAKCSKVLWLIPELKQSQLKIHTYLIRNIDYISNNGMDFYCCLCHENIKRSQYDINETEENLKHHLLSSVHEENMFGRQNCDSLVHDNLNEVMGIFTDEVLNNLKYLELRDDSLSCHICDEEIDIDTELSVNITLHFESESHRDRIYEEEQRCNNLMEQLDEVFGKIPSCIKYNLIYIELVRNNHLCCTLCKVTLQHWELENHLIGKKHSKALDVENSKSDLLEEGLKDLLGQDYKDIIPQCIIRGWDHIEYIRDTGNFFCILCEESILVDEGNKREEITLQNFKSHLQSAGHTTKLKEKAKKELVMCEQLESMFGGIPKCILSNINVLIENDDNSFYCSKCDVEIQFGSYASTTKLNFEKHLRSTRHICNIEDFETSVDNAYIFLDDQFAIPECLLRDIDFWANSDDSDLRCTLCQDDLSIDLDDLWKTRRELECHLDSVRHNYLLGTL